MKTGAIKPLSDMRPEKRNIYKEVYIMSMEKRNPENDPMTFKFEGHEIRIVQQEGFEPLFVASDVCKALGITNVGNALARLDDDEKDYVRSNDVRVGTNKLTVVTESGMYNLVLRSDKPIAKVFKRWVTHEVLPQVRKTGSYIQAPEPANLSPLDVLRQMVETFATQQQQIADLQEHDSRQDKDIAEIKALVQPEDDYFTVAGYVSYFKLGRFSNEELANIGKRAAALSRQKGIEMIDVPHVGAYWKTVHSYHVSILDEIVKR